jgi:hypothetical protein
LPYCSSVKDSGFSEIYYYSYDINKIEQFPIRISSPEATIINCISWKDFENEKQISIVEQNRVLGTLQKNASQINYEITGQIFNNDSIIDLSDICYICINVLGDI